MTIFVALTDSPKLKAEAEALYRLLPSTPRDSGDFDCCHYLLSLLPEWKNRLAEVGEKFPQTSWKELALIWNELETLFTSGQRKELSERIAGATQRKE